jgi:acyl-CoA synthetase (AMP-forming)/AMP-acid ligase II
MTLLGLLDHGAADHPAIVVPNGPTLSYHDLRHAVAREVEALARLGFGRDDRIALALPQSPEAIVAFLAAAHVGAAAPLNLALSEGEFHRSLEDVNAAALVVRPNVGPRPLRGRPGRTLVVEATIAGDRPLRPRGAVPLPGERIASEPEPDDVALVLHSSGTTGRPKRIALTHRNVQASIEQIVRTCRLGPNDVSLTVMPLFHVHGLIAGMLAPLSVGGTVVLPGRFAPTSFASLVRTHGVTWCTAVPTMLALIVARGVRGDDPPLLTLRFLRSASLRLPEPTRLRLIERFGVDVLEAYGMTEAAHQIASNPLRPGVQKTGTCGAPTGVELATMDPQGRLLPPDVEGEIVIRGPNVITHYDDNPEADAASFRDGWFRTGDLGRVDTDGYVTLVGRLKELINRGGEKIAPGEVDEVLLQHPAVAEAVCFGVPHPTWGEEVAAAVVLSGPADARDILRHCRERLAAFKVPKRLYIVTELPRTPTGKIQRTHVALSVRDAA